MTITSLMDDYCTTRGYVGEHGFSLFIDTPVMRVLFDAGQSAAFLSNARKSGVDVLTAQAVVLSHGHYDHGGGLQAFYNSFDSDASSASKLPSLYAGKGFASPRFSLKDKTMVPIGLATHAGSALPIVELDKNRQVTPGLWLLNEVPFTPAHDSRFRKGPNPEGCVIDDFSDEISLVFDEPDGLSIVSGCAHRGIGAIVSAAVNLMPGKPLKSLIGGFHLQEHDTMQLSSLIEMLKKHSPVRIVCAHCTGIDGYAALAAGFPGRVRWLTCGQRLEL